MSEKSIAKDYTVGTIPKQMFKFMIPFMLSNALQVLYSAVDMAIVGQFVGPDGITAVAQGSQIVNFGVMFILGFATGGQMLIAQVIGADKREELNSVIGTLVSLVGIMAVALTIIIVIPRQAILTLLNIPEESLQMGMEYILICGGGLIFTAGYNVISSILRGMGDSKRPFYFISIASVVNLILDMLFTGVLGWKVVGAALATIIGQAIAFVIALVYIYKRKDQFYFDFKLSSLRINKGYLKTISIQGIPAAIQYTVISFSMMLVSAMVNSLNSLTASATFGVGLKIDDICIKISLGIQYAAAPMIAQNYAAKKFDRVKQVVKWAWIYSFIYVGLFTAYYLPFGDSLFALFSNDAAVIAMSSEFRYAIFYEFICLAVMRGTGALIQGIGYAWFNLFLSILDGLILRVGFGWLFGNAMGLGFFGYILGYGLAPLGFAIPGVIYFISGRWQKRKALI